VGEVELGRRTQESCFQGGSVSCWEEVVGDGGRAWLLREVRLRPFVHPFCGRVGLSCMVMVSSPNKSISGLLSSTPGSGIFLPFTVLPSTGIIINLRLCMGSFGHIRLALRKMPALQLYFMLSPANVSPGLTLCIYTSASLSVLSACAWRKVGSMSSEHLLLCLPVESSIVWPLALSKTRRLASLTRETRSSFEPAPMSFCWTPLGPHSTGPTIVEFRELEFWDGLFLFQEPANDLSTSLPSTVEARPWIAETEVPQASENELYDFELRCHLAGEDLEGDSRAEAGCGVRLGDRSIRGRSSRSDRRRRVRGRRVELSVVLFEGEAVDCCIGALGECSLEREASRLGYGSEGGLLEVEWIRHGKMEDMEDT
jgi:hypothetical protein